MALRYAGIAGLIISLWGSTAFADQAATHRIPQFSNDRVEVWKTIVYPNTNQANKNQTLKMHRHEHDHVVVALTDGILKVTNDKGQSHEIKLVKGNAYYLPKDVAGELHTDENVSGHPINVMVIELR